VNEYPVAVVSASPNYADYGGCIYRADNLPQHGEEITVEIAVTADPSAPGRKIRARVTNIVPDADVPIHATELIE
jgi:hypothetical protein